MSRRASLWTAALGLTCALGTPSPPVRAAEPPLAERPMRFFPASVPGGVGQFIISGVRVEREADGSLQVGGERFDRGGEAEGVRVPAELGGGYLFFQPLPVGEGSGTALFRADLWTAPLQPLGTVAFTVDRARVGFDRFYLFGPGRQLAVDPIAGGWLSLEPLPTVATVLDLGFDGLGRGWLRAPLVGRLQTVDGGLSWHATGQQESGPESELDGLLPVLPEASGLARQVILRGVPVGKAQVLALIRGQQVRLDTSPFLLRQAPLRGLSPGLDCQGQPATRHVWFVCQGERTELWEHQAAKPRARTGTVRWTVLAALTGRRRALAAGESGVLFEGACGRERVAGQRQLCLLGPAGRTPLAIPDVSSSALQTHEVFAVGADGVRQIRLSPAGELLVSRIGTTEPESRYSLHDDLELRALVQRGSWLSGAGADDDGENFWAVQSESYVGLRLEHGETVARVGAIQKPLRRAYFSGKRALSWGASGFARSTTDGGITWSEILYPYKSGDPDPNVPTRSGEELALGCGPAGCSLGSWLTVGWGPTVASVAQVPPRLHVPPPGGGRFRFACSASQAPSAPSLAHARPVESTPGRHGLLAPFWERPAPSLSTLQEGVSVGDPTSILRLYAWGPLGAAWGSQGHVQVAFRSPFAAGSVRVSLPTPGLLLDGVRTRELFGELDRAGQLIRTELDPGGEAGVVLVRARQSAALFTFSTGGAVERFDVAEELELHALAGAVLANGRWFLGSVQDGAFRLLDTAAGHVRLLHSWPLGETGARESQLVRTLGGELGVAMSGDGGLLIYPLRPDGVLGEPILTQHRGSRPPSCPAEATGYLVVQELGIAPWLEAEGEELELSRVTTRRLVGFGAECLDAMAAQTRGDFSVGKPVVSAPGTPLLVSDHGVDGRRYELRCQ